ncbi:CMP-N,N'-diacetyllegionaminic acid synthase [Paenibacillus sp. 1_12]|uniref:acylneuraminate cytidylyltransferase family protein n=1 Tax=Paenibacillus sp. 1_12 TaxID=1566278 RepID=UPI0008DF6714|nr:acylneuraminate cytidylyltransferase family protein [Paenibacillus sp. 1_12]SFK81405.1 CMP-N,N'-diacetyllegionaminic acid synthase [Paenibacillus sp. 1_12]
MKRLCTICARGGSKGVPNKNVRYLLDKPLIAYSIVQAQKSGLFDQIAVSSDSEAILEIAASYGIHQLVKRPALLANDEAAKIPAIQHCTSIIEQRTGYSFNTVVDLDVTAPLREVQDIAGAVALLEGSAVRNVVSGHPSRRSPYFNMVELTHNGAVQLVKPLDSPFIRRQDAPVTYDLNASIYVWQRDWLLSTATLFNECTLLYVMPSERSIDIDTELDFQFVEYLHNSQLFMKAGDSPQESQPFTKKRSES